MPSYLPNGTHAPVSSSKPIQLALPLPHAPHSLIHIHLTILKNSLLLFLTTSSTDSGSTLAAMGSLVYAMPNVCPIHVPVFTVYFAKYGF